jgi:hypothetical protein
MLLLVCVWLVLSHRHPRRALSDHLLSAALSASLAAFFIAAVLSAKATDPAATQRFLDYVRGFASTAPEAPRGETLNQRR